MKTIYCTLFSMLFIIISCNKLESEEFLIEQKSKLVFYTNYEQPHNFGEFNIEVYIDSSLVGSILQPTFSSGTPVCEQLPNTLLIEKDTGNYNYYAKGSGLGNIEWFGNIAVERDSCYKILLNKEKISSNQNTNFIKEKLIGSWMQFWICDSCNLLRFYPNDTLVRINTMNLEEVSYRYELTAVDTIKVTRNWAVSPDIKTTTHKFHFAHQDTLELSQFIAVSIGTTGFEDVKLYKIK